MIELDYFPQGSDDVVYQVLQFRIGESWRVVCEGELICCMEKLDAQWYVKGKTMLSQELIEGIGRFIDAQYFNRLPAALKEYWEVYVKEVIAQGEDQYLIVCKEGIDFKRFEKIFRACILNLLRDPWEIRFMVYNAMMSDDFEVIAKGPALVY